MMFTEIILCWGPNSHYFHTIGDGHQPNDRGLYTRIPHWRWDEFIPNIGSCATLARMENALGECLPALEIFNQKTRDYSTYKAVFLT